MLHLLQVLTVMIVALSTALSVAHALELPGKMRLDETTYRAVQRIYYPGFTIGGSAEPLGIIATAVLLMLTPAGSAFWLVLGALLGLVISHAIFWLAVQPVNRHWMKGQPVSASASAFFAVGTSHSDRTVTWIALRNRWEYSHVARALSSSAGLLALVTSLIAQP